ncbi:MAG: EAL domain-containing protein, partial [Phycisphaeraceae bacterium]
LNEATRQLRQWQQEFDLPEDFSVNVNLSKVQVISDSILDDVSDALASSGVQPQHLTLEITESSIMHSVALVTSVLEKLRDRGVVLAMDDFGKGYSSLASLHRFPIHMLKIDRDFIHTMTQSRAHLAVIDAITSLAGNLGLQVIAEGIEANDEVFQLQALECSYGQGYFFAKPRSPEEIRPLLESAHQLVGGA